MDDHLDLSDVTVLVLDDIPAMRRLLGEVLRGLGCGRVYDAANVDAAMQVLLTFKVDVVFCDVALGNGDGLEFVREVRSGGGETADIPIIMVSAHSTRKRVEAAAHAGATYFLAKPISIRGIADHLVRALASPCRSHAPEQAKEDVFLL